MRVNWPHGHKFAFTIFDDTDWATLERIKPVYDLLIDLGMRTTKSVWIFKGDDNSINSGMTCDDTEYLKWVLWLNHQGFEIGFHNAAPRTSSRPEIVQALDHFREHFGDRKMVHSNHVGCLDSIYWGDIRLSGWRREIYNILTLGQNRDISRGHIEDDPLFWGDLCQERVRYVRSFVFNELNLLKACPEIPYHDPSKLFVNLWFPSTNGGNLTRFLGDFTRDNVDRLVEEGGLCIAYVHFADGFAKNGKVVPEFGKRLEYISAKDGWFAPVSDVLDFLTFDKGLSERAISPKRLRTIESRWLMNKVLDKASGIKRILM
jgi:hypothetical protein